MFFSGFSHSRSILVSQFLSIYKISFYVCLEISEDKTVRTKISLKNFPNKHAEQNLSATSSHPEASSNNNKKTFVKVNFP